MTIQIRDLTELDIKETAKVLYLAFAEHHADYVPTEEDAQQELHDCMADEMISRIAVNDQGVIVGMIGGRPSYAYVWELHPLAVHPDHERQGVGGALVLDLEARVKVRGGMTIMLGTDDENNQTSLSGVDLYPDVWEHVKKIGNINNHPYEFYQKMGYVIVGLVPDANGFGKPDILMAKRLFDPPK